MRGSIVPRRRNKLRAREARAVTDGMAAEEEGS